MEELEFIREIANHREFCRKLAQLGLPDAEAAVRTQALTIGARWFLLGQEHLKEARLALRGGVRRAAYSRAYYAAYSASRSVRYIATGSVSLRGDDHQKAPELPGDFPEPTKWGPCITKLYQERLRADYENWRTPPTKFGINASTAVREAAAFVALCKRYLKSKHGVTL